MTVLWVRGIKTSYCAIPNAQQIHTQTHRFHSKPAKNSSFPRTRESILTFILHQQASNPTYHPSSTLPIKATQPENHG
jgi:hypothetical protein